MAEGSNYLYERHQSIQHVICQCTVYFIILSSFEIKFVTAGKVSFQPICCVGNLRHNLHLDPNYRTSERATGSPTILDGTLVSMNSFHKMSALTRTSPYNVHVCTGTCYSALFVQSNASTLVSHAGDPKWPLTSFKLKRSAFSI